MTGYNVLGPWHDAAHAHCVHLVVDPAHPHAEGLRDAAQGLSDAFAMLGGSALLVTHRCFWLGRAPIIVGAHLLHAIGLEIPSNAILFNLEQVSAESSWFTPAYVDLLRRHRVLDYSTANTRALADAYGIHATTLPIRANFAPAVRDMSPAAQAKRDIDVLFFGSVNARRLHVLEQLRSRDFNVVSLFGVYGAERAKMVERAKVVLNLHFYEAAIFEAVRCCPLMAAGVPVVSEGSPDDPDVADIADGIAWASYDDLAERCACLVADRVARTDLARRALVAIGRSSQTVVLRDLFGAP